MAIGERIHFTRNLSDMTQKYLGTLVGFPEKTADIRMAQYEADTRTPMEDLLKPWPVHLMYLRLHSMFPTSTAALV